MVQENFAVQFWRKKWFGKVREIGRGGWLVCSSSNWSLCLCRVELWVNNLVYCFFFIFSWNPYEWKYFSLFFLHWIQLREIIDYLMLIWVFILFWNRGFPIWLHFIPGIVLRSDNEPFKVSLFPIDSSIYLISLCYLQFIL